MTNKKLEKEIIEELQNDIQQEEIDVSKIYIDTGEKSPEDSGKSHLLSLLIGLVVTAFLVALAYGFYNFFWQTKDKSEQKQNSTKESEEQSNNSNEATQEDKESKKNKKVSPEKENSENQTNNKKDKDGAGQENQKKDEGQIVADLKDDPNKQIETATENLKSKSGQKLRGVVIAKVHDSLDLIENDFKRAALSSAIKITESSDSSNKEIKSATNQTMLEVELVLAEIRIALAEIATRTDEGSPE